MAKKIGGNQMVKKILAYMMVFLMLITLVPSKIYAEEVKQEEKEVPKQGNVKTSEGLYINISNLKYEKAY